MEVTAHPLNQVGEHGVGEVQDAVLLGGVGQGRTHLGSGGEAPPYTCTLYLGTYIYQLLIKAHQ